MSWHASLPSPESTPSEITPAELAALPGVPGVGYVVVDARRTDIIGVRTISFEAHADGQDEDAAHAMIPSAINLPAQTFYPTLPVVGQLLKNIPTVVFHCNSCSTGGRGRRAAGWYQDWLDAEGITTSRAVVLAGGWKAWIAAYPEQVVKV